MRGSSVPQNSRQSTGKTAAAAVVAAHTAVRPKLDFGVAIGVAAREATHGGRQSSTCGGGSHVLARHVLSTRSFT